MPAGICILNSSAQETKPWPRHSWQSFSYFLPSPPQSVQATTERKLPKKVFLETVTCPEPPQVLQVSILAPGSPPLPWQCPQTTFFFKDMVFSTPKTESSKLTVI